LATLGRPIWRLHKAEAERVSTGEKYVAAAYLVVLVALLAWVGIIGTKLARLSREVEELVDLARRRERERDAA